MIQIDAKLMLESPPSGYMRSHVQFSAHDEGTSYRVEYKNLQKPLLDLLFITLNLVPDLKVLPVVEAETAFVPLAHLRHVFLHVFERGERT